MCDQPAYSGRTGGRYEHYEEVSLITGANRGIGLALVSEALRRGRRGYMQERAAR